VTYRNQDLKLNTFGMTIHLLTYVIYLVGLLYWFI